MSKRPSKKSIESLPAMHKAEAPIEASHTLLPHHSLAAIRAKVLKVDADARATERETREENARIIADLEGLRDEIERTIAFLKARR